MPDLHGVYFYRVTEFLYHSTTTELVPLLELVRG